jgi:hypothetical protein
MSPFIAEFSEFGIDVRAIGSNASTRAFLKALAMPWMVSRLGFPTIPDINKISRPYMREALDASRGALARVCKLSSPSVCWGTRPALPDLPSSTPTGVPDGLERLAPEGCPAGAGPQGAFGRGALRR